ncbi:MAG: hypothetical protein NTU63_04105 [Candidatus Pacearchaeota archaeon]|nr:hypothetical protein [Candidatus Pacearchaeota archaeon]
MNQQKAIIFDSSTLINFAMNGLLEEFRDLKRMFGGKFLITKEVKWEIIDNPMEIKRFELEALKLNELFLEKVLEMPSSIGIDEKTVSKMTQEIKNIANNTFFGYGKGMEIIAPGESSCLALSKLLDEKGIKHVIAVDERTTRILGERPENLEKLFLKKMHTKITAKKENFKFFKEFRFVRSAELIYIAYKKGIIKLRNHDVLDALLYAMKFNGCSISDEEISDMKKL